MYDRNRIRIQNQLKSRIRIRKNIIPDLQHNTVEGNPKRVKTGIRDSTKITATAKGLDLDSTRCDGKTVFKQRMETK